MGRIYCGFFIAGFHDSSKFLCQAVVPLMKKILLFLFIFISVNSCRTAPETYVQVIEPRPVTLEDTLNQAEAEATPEGRRVLETSRSMINKKEIVVGGCWDFINAVFNHAGFENKKRETIYQSKLKGPYLEVDLIQPGDWLYFVNHTYNDVEHSAIFVTWIDKEKKEALMVNYVGENKKKPAFYKKFILDEVYNVIRAVTLETNPQIPMTSQWKHNHP